MSAPDDPTRRFNPAPPPPPQPQVVYVQQQPKKRRGCLYTLLGLIAVVVIGIIVGVSNSGNSSSGGSSSGSGAQAAAATAGIGQPVRDGKFEFTITSISTAKSVGDTAYGGGATAQGTYQILHLTVKNIGDQAQTLDDSAQYLYDAAGHKYSADSSADIWLGNGSNNVWLQQINPGNTVTGEMAFDMPTGTAPVKAELHDSMFSDGATVKLQ